MKKIISTLLIIILTFSPVIALSACRPIITIDDDTTAVHVLEAINNALGVQSPCRGLYQMGVPQDSSRHMSTRLATLVYQGDQNGVHELSILADYAVFLSCDHSLYEVHAMRVYSIADREQIVKLLDRRLTLIRQREIYLFQPDSYENRVADAMVYTRGNWIFLLATGNNEAAIDVIRELT